MHTHAHCKLARSRNAQGSMFAILSNTFRLFHAVVFEQSHSHGCIRLNLLLLIITLLDLSIFQTPIDTANPFKLDMLIYIIISVLIFQLRFQFDFSFPQFQSLILLVIQSCLPCKNATSYTFGYWRNRLACHFKFKRILRVKSQSLSPESFCKKLFNCRKFVCGSNTAHKTVESFFQPCCHSKNAI